MSTETAAAPEVDAMVEKLFGSVLGGMEALTIASLTSVSEEDPPPSMSGMAAVRLDPQGRLIAFEAVPPQVEGTPTASSPPDWSPLFTEAGLDPARFSPMTPERLPPTYADARMAWVESHPERTDRPFRIEAAAYRGKPVYFELLGPWSRPARMGSPEQSAARKAELMLIAGVQFLSQAFTAEGAEDRRLSTKFTV